ncbi:MAG: MFS transporter [Spirochaetes bacterium]|nr:MFS transporter [Spirochaetota bacterium]
MPHTGKKTLKKPILPKPAAVVIKASHSYIKSFPLPVWLLVCATFVESMGRFMVVPYLSLYMRSEGVDLGTLGLVLGAAPIANVVFGAWGGHLSDRLGRKPIQILGVSISGLSMFGFAFAGANPLVLALLNFMNGMTRTFYRPATSAALSDHCPAKLRSEAFALNRIAINVAYGLGPILGVAIFQTHPLYGFIIAGSINLLVGLFIAITIPESAPGVLAAPRVMAAPGEKTKVTRTGTLAATLQPGAAQTRTAAAAVPPAAITLQTAATSAQTAATLTSQPAQPAWKVILKDGGFWIWTAGMMLVWGSYDLIQSFLPLHLQSAGISLWVYSAILACNAVICVLVQLPVSRLLRTAPFAFSAGFSKLAFAAGFIGFALLRSPALLIAAMLILSLGEVWGSAVQVRYIPEHVHPSLLGRYMGLSMVSELGRAIAAPAAGFLMAAFGGPAVFFMAAALAAGGGVLLYLAGKAQDSRRP